MADRQLQAEPGSGKVSGLASQNRQDRRYLKRLGLQVRVLRTARELTQDQLADLAGLDRTYISRVERGAHNITVLTLVRVAQALDVAPGELLDSAAEDSRFTGLGRKTAEQ